MIKFILSENKFTLLEKISKLIEKLMFCLFLFLGLVGNIAITAMDYLNLNDLNVGKLFILITILSILSYIFLVVLKFGIHGLIKISISEFSLLWISYLAVFNYCIYYEAKNYNKVHYILIGLAIFIATEISSKFFEYKAKKLDSKDLKHKGFK